MNWLLEILNSYRGPSTWGDVFVSFGIAIGVFLVFWGLVNLGV